MEEEGIKEKKEEEKPEESKETQSNDKENKVLRNVLVGIGVIIVIMILVIVVANLMSHFKYKGMKFNMEKFGEIITYHTSFPIYSKAKSLTTGEIIADKHVADYNVYLRNDPRELDKIHFDRGLVLLKNMVINISDDLDCGGDGTISLVNMVNLFDTLGIEVIKDDNAGCDREGRYMYLNIFPADYSGIEKIGAGCYELYVNNCEVLEVTERFMIETLVKVVGEEEN